MDDCGQSALATASVGIGTSGAGIIIVVFTVLVALGGGALVYHYHRRITGASRDADRIAAYFREAGIDFSKTIPVALVLSLLMLTESAVLGVVIALLFALAVWLALPLFDWLFGQPSARYYEALGGYDETIPDYRDGRCFLN
jgi:hypothetical protein